MNTATALPSNARETAQEDHALTGLAALSQRQRLRAFRALVVAGPDGLTAGEIAAALELSPSALSFHLKELTHAQLVEVEAQGRNMLYRARFDTMNGLLDYLTEHCCAGESCSPTRTGKRGC